MDFSRRMDGSSEWSGRGSRSRDSSTSVSKSDKREQFDDVNAMIQTLAMGVRNSTAAATATTSAVAAIGEEVKKEVATVGEGC